MKKETAFRSALMALASLPLAGLFSWAGPIPIGSGLKDSVSGEAPREAEPLESSSAKAVFQQIYLGNQDLHDTRYREALQDYDYAIFLDRQARALNPTEEAFIYEKMGTAYQKLGLAQQAIENLQQSLRDVAFNPTAYYELALAYANLGQFSDSLQAVQKTWETSLSAKELRRYLLLAKTDSELEPIRNMPGFWDAVSAGEARLKTLR